MPSYLGDWSVCSYRGEIHRLEVACREKAYNRCLGFVSAWHLAVTLPSRAPGLSGRIVSRGGARLQGLPDSRVGRTFKCEVSALVGEAWPHLCEASAGSPLVTGLPAGTGAAGSAWPTSVG